MRVHARAAVVIACALLASPSVGRAAKPKAAPAALSERTFHVERHTLDNGLTVLLHEDHAVPTVTLWQWYKVGSRNERPGITGISHFFEHMMFNGSKNVPPKEYDRIIESNGGSSNAFTDHDMTAYYEDISSDHLDVLLRLDADRMASLSLLPEQLKSEIEVVKEERRLRVDNDVNGMLDESLWAAAFMASPYHWPVIGWMADLNAIAREDMIEYFRIHYAPNNCILVLTGDFDSCTALAEITKAFGSIPRQPQAAEPVTAEPEQRGERRVDVHYPAQSVTVQLGYKAPSVKSADYYTLDVIATLLSDGESSRLHKALVYEQQIALYTAAYYQAQLDQTLFIVAVGLKPDQPAPVGIAGVDSVLARLVRDGPTPRELQKAKNIKEASFVKGLKTNNGVGLQLGFYEHIFGDYRGMFGALDKYRAVTAADVQRVAASVFAARQRTIATLVPEAEESAQ